MAARTNCSLQLSRRALLAGASLATTFLAVAALPMMAVADRSEPGGDRGSVFSFDLLAQEMQALAAEPHVPGERPEGFFQDLDYDGYRLIRFRDDAARLLDVEGGMFRLQAFHMGWLFAEPVRLFEVSGGRALEMPFTTEDFEYLNELSEQVPDDLILPGIAGFRLLHPINRPDRWDEVVAFLGASYFRALGRGSNYGISARGLTIDTATSEPEEFPRFSRFYVESAPGADEITVYAALESPSVTGAYRFEIRPGAETVMDVTARLFFREDVTELGIAPLTSMFLFAEKNRTGFDDYRPNVHDSNGLRIERADGDVIWRPLNNPPALAGSYFAETAPRAFGLYQRDRDFGSFQDAEARYERRPSLRVEPMGDWGPGAVRLVEIPTKLEVNDNIVAFWVPETPVRAGDALAVAYRLRWGDLPPDADAALAWVDEMRSGAGGVSGVESAEGTRKFVVDFRGGPLADLPADAGIEAVTSVQHGEIVSSTLEHIEGADVWRLVMDVASERGATVELSAHLAGYGRKLTEIWLYQWINA